MLLGGIAMKLSDTKKAVIDDTILFIWNEGSKLNLAMINRLIQELIEVIEV